MKEDRIADALADLDRADLHSRDAKALYCLVIAARISILLARPDLRRGRGEQPQPEAEQPAPEMA